MSRRSARIRSQKRKFEDITEREVVSRGHKRKFEDITEQEIANTFNKKQKNNNNACDITMEVERRRQQFLIQNQWVPIANDSSVTKGVLVATNNNSLPSSTQPSSSSINTDLKNSSCLISPHKNNTTPQELLMAPNTLSGFRFHNLFATPVALRNSPLPSLNWADSREVWQLMLKKEELYVRNVNMLDRHQGLQPRMRAILLDWLIEVCEVYRLHRESFHLAVDFIDRYLCVTRELQKSQLQLIGITGLFVAAKLEEIYPPKLAEFAYVTDGACEQQEILDQELVMLKSLNWDLCPMTANSWLNIFLQLVNVEQREDTEQNFVMPQYSQHAFIQIARLLDLCNLELGSLEFSYSVLATSATYHMSSEHVALSVSGYTWMDIAACVQWMAPFAVILSEEGSLDLKYFQHISNEDAHNIQTHAVELCHLERAQARASAMDKASRCSPEALRQHPGIITPPQTPASNSSTANRDAKKETP